MADRHHRTRGGHDRRPRDRVELDRAPVGARPAVRQHADADRVGAPEVGCGAGAFSPRRGAGAVGVRRHRRLRRRSGRSPINGTRSAPTSPPGVQTLVDAAVDVGIERPIAEDAADSASTWTAAVTEFLINGAISLLPAIAALLATMFLSVFVAFFFLKDGPLMWRWIVSRVSDDSGVFDDIGRSVWRTVSAFALGQATIAAIDAVFIWLGAVLLGVPNASAILMLTFLGAFVPYIGAFVAGLIAVLLALSDGGIAHGVAMLAVVVAVQVIEGNVLQPWIQGKAVRLHPLVVALAVVAGGALAGFLGVLLAVPVCAAGVVTLGQLRNAGLLGSRQHTDST